MRDHFRPHFEPARAIYDALVREQKYRDGRSCEEWQEAELYVVWDAARDYALQAGLTVPTMDDVQRADQQAMGHVDYAAKLAHGVVDVMRPMETSQDPADCR